MSNFANNALSIDKISTSKVLPDIKTTETGGNTALYESNKIGGKKEVNKWDRKGSKKGGKKQTRRKNNKMKRTNKNRK